MSFLIIDRTSVNAANIKEICMNMVENKEIMGSARYDGTMTVEYGRSSWITVDVPQNIVANHEDFLTALCSELDERTVNLDEFIKDYNRDLDKQNGNVNYLEDIFR